MIHVQSPNFEIHKQWLAEFFQGTWSSENKLIIDSNRAVGKIFAFNLDTHLNAVLFQVKYREVIDYRFRSNENNAYTMQFFIPKLSFQLNENADRKDLSLPRGFFFTKSNIAFEGQMSPNNVDYHVTLFFDDKAVESYGLESVDDLPNIIFMRADRVIGSWLTMINSVLQDDFTADESVVELAVQQLFILSLHQMRNKNRKGLSKNISDYEMKSVFYVRDQLLEDLKQKPNLEFLVTETGINLTKLEKLFKLFFETTIYKFFNQKRLEEVRDLYLSGNHSLYELAMDYNFTDINHLSNAYKKEFLVSPKNDLKRVVEGQQIV